MKALKYLLLFSGLILLAWFLGPQLPEEKLNSMLPELGLDIKNVESYVEQIENKHPLRPDNHARIVWANDSLKEKTIFSLLYLHGTSASWYEGYPTHIEMAKSLKANLYLSRLASHGIDTSEALIDMTPYSLYESVKEALLIASALGEKVVVAGTSTGGALALKLAADYPDIVHGVVLFSPNIAIYDFGATLLSGPWGLQIAHLVGGTGKYRVLDPGTEKEREYWYKTYRWEATVYLQQMLDATMKKEVFSKVDQPVFLAYYYKNEKEQDRIVKLSAMLKMFDQLGTPEELKVKIVLPDAGHHVIGCEELSGSVDELIIEVNKFLTQFFATS